MNMGVGDAADLGWKLAATLAGWGGEALLDSYEIERRQVHQRVVDESVMNHKHSSGSLVHPLLDAEGPEADAVRTQAREKILALKAPEFHSLGVVIGAHYEDSPVLLREAADAPTLAPRPDYVPNARPGCRAPQLWLHEGTQAGAALCDHFTPQGFTLLATGTPDAAQLSAVRDAAAARGVPLQVLAPQDPRLPALYGAAYVLVRPDQFVAWRGDDAQHAIRALDIARGLQPAPTAAEAVH